MVRLFLFGPGIAFLGILVLIFAGCIFADLQENRRIRRKKKKAKETMDILREMASKEEYDAYKSDRELLYYAIERIEQYEQETRISLRTSHAKCVLLSIEPYVADDEGEESSVESMMDKIEMLESI